MPRSLAVAVDGAPGDARAVQAVQVVQDVQAGGRLEAAGSLREPEASLVHRTRSSSRPRGPGQAAPPARASPLLDVSVAEEDARVAEASRATLSEQNSVTLGASSTTSSSSLGMSGASSSTSTSRDGKGCASSATSSPSYGILAASGATPAPALPLRARRTAVPAGRRLRRGLHFDRGLPHGRHGRGPPGVGLGAGAGLPGASPQVLLCPKEGAPPPPCTSNPVPPPPFSPNPVPQTLCPQPCASNSMLPCPALPTMYFQPRLFCRGAPCGTEL